MLRRLLGSLLHKPAAALPAAVTDPALLAQYNFALQFFTETRVREKRRLRPDDAARLQRIRASARYREPFELAEPLVTVIVPTFNRADVVLERTLPSVLRQSYENWEILVVGDRMPDELALRLDAFRHPRVRFINLKRRGLYPEQKGPLWYVAGTKPMNYGLRIARGHWIAHLDDDDEFLPEHLEQLLRAARTRNVEWAHGKVRFVSDDPERPSTREVGSASPRMGTISRISSIYHAGLKTFRYNGQCWRYFYPGDWDLWERFLDMGVTRTYLDRVTAIHHGNPGRTFND